MPMSTDPLSSETETTKYFYCRRRDIAQSVTIYT